MRDKNGIVFICVVFAALGAYIVLSIATQIWIGPQPGRVDSISIFSQFQQIGLVWRYGVLVIAGAVLCRLVDSPVPLKWCLGLGLLFAGIHFLPWLSFWPQMPQAAAPFSLHAFTVGRGFGDVVAPVVGAGLVKPRYLAS